MSTLRVTNISNAGGTKTVPADTVVDGSAKAWVNFNGTGTVAIRRAFNVSSITDNGTGDYTVNFTNAMSDANFAAASNNNANGGSMPQQAKTSSSYRLLTLNSGYVATDYANNDVSIFS